MPSRKYRLPAAIALLLGFAVLFFICILTAVHVVGTDGALYYSEQMKADILPQAGISGEDLKMLDERLADYLAGDEAALNQTPDGDAIIQISVYGEPQPAFNDREMTHMRDCYGLFALLRKVRARLIPWAILLIVGGAYLLRDRRRIRKIVWLSPLIILAPLGAFAVWAAVDFNAAFNAFHRALFTNDLWLLDPRTDLLIRICPQSMFMAMGLRIAVYSLISMIAIPAVVTLLTFILPKGKEANTWNNRDMRRASAQKQMTFAPKGKR